MKYTLYKTFIAFIVVMSVTALSAQPGGGGGGQGQGGPPPGGGTGAPIDNSAIALLIVVASYTWFKLKEQKLQEEV